MNKIKHGYPNNPRIVPPIGNPGKNADSKYRPRLWALEVIDAPGAWLVPATGPEQTVCIIDTGFTTHHQDLLPTGSGEEIELDSSGVDDGHGTVVGGIIAAAHDTGHGRAGICPRSRIQAFKVGKMIFLKDWSLVKLGKPFDQMTGRIAEAIDLVNKHFATLPVPSQVISISKSSPPSGAEIARSVVRRYLLSNVDTFLGMGGLLVVGGSNNDGAQATACYPAAIKHVSSRPDSILVVGGIAISDRLWNCDARQWNRGQNDVDVYAPGGLQEVLDHSSTTKYKYNEGNSLAIPYVAGLAAYLLRINPLLDGKTVANIIKETAEAQRLDTGGRRIPLVNAFAAALKVYNDSLPDSPLAGYRVSMPLEFSQGTLKVNDTIIPVCTFGRSKQAFCRFTAPLDLDIHARLYKHQDLKTDGSNRCYWEGSFRHLLISALPNSKGSAWSHSAVDALRTVRLQGIAARIYYPGKREAVVNAGVLLVEKSRGTRFEGRTDHEGYCVIPFGEPGKYVLSVEEEGIHYEVERDLKENQVYEDDIVLGESDSRNKWKSTWAGDVLYQGNAAVYEQGTGVSHEEFEKFVVYPGDLHSRDLYTVSGSITLKISSNVIEKEPLIHNVLVGDDFIQDLVYEEGTDAVTPDMLPALSPVTIRAFSKTLCRVQHGFSEEIVDRLRDWEFGAWGGGFGAHEKDQFAYLPSGLLVAAGERELEFELSLPSLIRRLLQARIQKEPHEQHRIPLWIDVSVHWCLDYSNVHGEGSEIQIASVQGRVHPASIPYRIEHLSQDPKIWRVVAGPARGILEFITHPKNPMKIEMETLSHPGTHISAIVQEPACSIGVPREFRELWVLSSQGELSLIDPLSTRKQKLMQNSTALNLQKDAPAQQPQTQKDEKVLGLRQLEARQQREREQAETFIKLQRMGPQEAWEHMEMIEERHKRQREEFERS